MQLFVTHERTDNYNGTASRNAFNNQWEHFTNFEVTVNIVKIGLFIKTSKDA